MVARLHRKRLGPSSEAYDHLVFKSFPIMAHCDPGISLSVVIHVFRKLPPAYDLRMLPRTPELLLLFAVLSACSVELVCSAEQTQSLAPVRFHFGDDPEAKLGWANPNFDDSAWPEGQNDGFPAPDYDSDGFFWVRSQIAVPAGAAGPLAIESQTFDAARRPPPLVDRVDGRLRLRSHRDARGRSGFSWSVDRELAAVRLQCDREQC